MAADRGDYTVGWVCALPIELAAAKAILDEEDEYFLHDNESLVYTLGRVGDHNVVIACLPAGQMGTNSAAAAAAQMKSKFTAVRFGLMVGVGGGVPGRADVRLGDVVVSQPENGHGGVVQYDFGKAMHGDVFRRTGSLNTPPTTLLSAVAEVKANHLLGRAYLAKALSTLSSHAIFAAPDPESDVLFPSAYLHEKQIKREPRPNREVVIHYGAIASGNSVIKDGLLRDRLDSELGGVLCFEMEAAGLMNSFPCLIIRGICDYSDSHKNKQWQPYASATAAACAKEILSILPSRNVVPMKTVQDTIDLEERTWSAIDNVDLDKFLAILPTAGQEEWLSPEHPLDSNDPAHATHKGNPVIWIYAYVVNQNIYDCSGTTTVGVSLITAFLATLLHQCLFSLPSNQGVAMARLFLELLCPNLVESEAILHQVFNLPAKDVSNALAHLLIVIGRRFLLVVDGLDKAAPRKVEFVQRVQDFIARVSNGLGKNGLNVFVMLTSLSTNNITHILRDVATIEYDKEWKDLPRVRGLLRVGLVTP
ncbi:nucleoside phosphorylase domain-containing protein [Aspergillus heterothallicus]